CSTTTSSPASTRWAPILQPCRVTCSAATRRARRWRPSWAARSSWATVGRAAPLPARSAQLRAGGRRCGVLVTEVVHVEPLADRRAALLALDRAEQRDARPTRDERQLGAEQLGRHPHRPRGRHARAALGDRDADLDLLAAH